MSSIRYKSFSGQNYARTNPLRNNSLSACEPLAISADERLSSRGHQGRTIEVVGAGNDAGLMGFHGRLDPCEDIGVCGGDVAFLQRGRGRGERVTQDHAGRLSRLRSPSGIGNELSIRRLGRRRADRLDSKKRPLGQWLRFKQQRREIDPIEHDILWKGCPGQGQSGGEQVHGVGELTGHTGFDPAGHPSDPRHAHPAFPSAACAILQQTGAAALIAHDQPWAVIACEEDERVLGDPLTTQGREHLPDTPVPLAVRESQPARDDDPASR